MDSSLDLHLFNNKLLSWEIQCLVKRLLFQGSKQSAAHSQIMIQYLSIFPRVVGVFA